MTSGNHGTDDRAANTVACIVTALSAWAATLCGRFIYRRENEFISDFVFSTLIHYLDDPRRLCIEGAVPQLRGDRRKAQIRKDLVVWGSPGQTCFDATGSPTCFPDVVVEWKGRTTDLHAGDTSWLQAFTSASACRHGLVVSVDQGPGWAAISYRRVQRGALDAVASIRCTAPPTADP